MCNLCPIGWAWDGRAMPRDDHFLTVREVADAMRVSTMTVYRLIRSGELHATRVGRSYRLREAELDSYLGRESA